MVQVRNRPDTYGSMSLPDDTASIDILQVPIDSESGSLIPTSNIDRDKKGTETDFSWLSRRYPSIIMATVAVIVILSYAGERTISLRNDNTKAVKTSEVGIGIPINSVSVDEADAESVKEEVVVTIPYTLTRKGYAELPYFVAGASEVTAYQFLADYQSIIEPHVDMMLTVYAGSSSAASYTYKVCDAATGSECYSGTYVVDSADSSQSINVPCTAFTPYTFEVEGVDASGNIVTSNSAKAMCMYVRRELREYTDADVTATMDAMYTLWTTTDAEGHSLYGSSFHSAKYFSIAHDFNAGQRDADHIHQGLGFVPQHIKLTNMFEASMQAVNPAVSMPYWDFTVDVAEGKTIYESVMFTDKTFGSITQPKDLLLGFTYANDALESTAIQDGRWAFTKSEIYDDFSLPQAKGVAVKGGTVTSSGIQANAFGFMRGPWNMNPSPYISRFTTHNDPELPTCYNYFYGVAKTDFLDFLQWAPYGPHAATHAVVGGVYGCDKMNWAVDEGFVADAAMQQKLCAFWGVVMKELYRGQYIDPNTGCSAATLSDTDISCGYTCNTEKYETMYEAIKPLIVRFVAEGVAGADHTWSTFRDFICKGDGYKIFVGDHLESASTSDPSFWPGHPTLERLVQLKYMTGVGAGFEWPTTAKGYAATAICDAPSCYEPGFANKGTYTQCCYGHNEYDQLLDFVNRDTTRTVGPTNHDTMVGTDPTSAAYAMPYIYNHFTWSHCEEDFAGAIKDMHSANAAKLAAARR